MFVYYKIKHIVIVAAGVGVCTVILVSALVSGSSHAAVWMGVSTSDGKNWLQAGVEKTVGQHVAEYIEAGRGGRQVSFRSWPTRFGHKARIRLYHRRALWRIVIDGHRSRWWWMPHAHLNTLALLETYRQDGVVHAVAVIH